MLHRINSLLKIAIITLLLANLSGEAWSQIRHRTDQDTEDHPRDAPKKKEKGPRALGVLEITSNGKARLIPITILVGDKWYDAGLYMADPRPMSLEPQTVYEGFLAGQSKGLFTVTGAQEVSDNWIGLGIWKPTGLEVRKKPKTAETKRSESASADDERPVLRRPGSSAKPTTPSAPSATTTQTPTPKAPDAKPAEEAKTKPEPRRSDEDANRPVLRRGKPGVEQAEGIPFPSSSMQDFPAAQAGQKNATAKPGAPLPVITATIAAISDSGGPDPRSYIFYLNAGEREGYMEQMTKLASQSLQKFVATRFRGVKSPEVTADNSRLDIYDVNTSNNPVLILTAKVPGTQAAATSIASKKGAPVAKRAAQVAAKPESPVAATSVPSGLEYYVTVVSRVDVNGEVRPLYETVTDSTRLDAYPKLDLIDAVDANGDGVGELLFRETYDRGRAYIVYRVGMDQLWPLFEGAQR